MAEMPNETWKAVGDRVRAARIAAGYRNRAALARDVKLPRFGDATIGDVERGSRELYEHEAEELGRVLSVPADSFYPSPAGETQLDRIESKLDTLLSALAISLDVETDQLDAPRIGAELRGALRPGGEGRRRVS